MTTKATFEDRLLTELRREIDRRASGTSDLAAVPAPAPSRRRTAVTAPRLGLLALACAAAAAAWVLMPGSPAGTPAYALEAHPDGSVTLTLKDMALGGHLQDGLAERLERQGIHVAVDELPAGYECTHPRGKTLPGRFAPDGGEGGWEITLRRGDSLAFESITQPRPDGSRQRVVSFYGVRGEIAPCDPVRAPEPRPTPAPGLR
ncbi:hypothetical protein ACWC10_10255 [Streptomyces sp. NPDC001595]|uniref:hypothetical protein n=1 Tax=Streptomyces sp. NPDC001532 TaxID=3154520 RepID=UPI003317D0EB